MLKKSLMLATMLWLGTASISARAAGITVTQNTDANAIAAALTAGNSGITVTSAVLDARTSGTSASSGTYNVAGTNNYNLTHPGIIFSTGDVSAYASGADPTPPPASTSFGYGVAATAAQNTLLTPITGGNPNHFDVTELTITFTAAATTNQVFFNGIFGSEEYPQFVNSTFVDGFGLILNGTNIAFVNSDPLRPVNIHDAAFVSNTVIPETDLNGVLAPGGNPLMTFTGAVTPGSTGNTLTIILADTSDSSLDTTVYLESLGSVNIGPGPGPGPGPSVPEPASVVMMGIGFVAVAGLSLRNRRRAA